MYNPIILKQFYQTYNNFVLKFNVMLTLLFALFQKVSTDTKSNFYTETVRKKKKQSFLSWLITKRRNHRSMTRTRRETVPFAVSTRRCRFISLAYVDAGVCVMKPQLSNRLVTANCLYRWKAVQHCSRRNSLAARDTMTKKEKDGNGMEMRGQLCSIN